MSSKKSGVRSQKSEWLPVAVLLLALPGVTSAQKPTPQPAWMVAWQHALDEAGASSVDALRAFETYLKQFPDSPQTQEAERYLLRSAIDLKDDPRTALYGERVLELAPDDVAMLDRVARAELHLGGAENAARALKHARAFAAIVENLPPADGRDAAKKQEERDRGLARMLLYQSRAKRILGEKEEAEKLAARGFQVYPNEEAAREWAEVLVALDRQEDAVRRYADGFAIPDARAADADRAADRQLAGELYRKLHGSEAGLGDVILAAYDRTSALLAERIKKARAIDPNLGLTDPMQFTLTALDGSKLALAKLRGSVVVLDFWATWCQPCRAQHPLYEELKKRFHDHADVVFLSIDTDEDRSLVAPFLEQIGWSRTVYFDDGLQRLLQVSSIPSTILFDKQGRIASRMNGFIPDSFVEQITERINAALH
jgi:thiol-disulfide isomerase/thioredoxin